MCWQVRVCRHVDPHDQAGRIYRIPQTPALDAVQRRPGPCLRFVGANFFCMHDTMRVALGRCFLPAPSVRDDSANFFVTWCPRTGRRGRLPRQARSSPRATPPGRGQRRSKACAATIAPPSHARAARRARHRYACYPTPCCPRLGGDTPDRVCDAGCDTNDTRNDQRMSRVRPMIEWTVTRHRSIVTRS